VQIFLFSQAMKRLGNGKFTAVAAFLVTAAPALAALESGVYHTARGATVEEIGDRLPGNARIVPLSATLAFDLESAPPTLTAVLSNAVLEGGPPFALIVRSSSGTKLADGSYRFSGDYLADTHPSGTQYLFDWRFSTAADSRLVWDGDTFWSGGHIWAITIADVTITPDTTGPQLDIARDGSQLRLSWSAVWSGYELEQSSDLSAASWNPVSQSPAVAAGRYSLAVENVAARMFFRLRKS
jgi:hypothetical protein